MAQPIMHICIGASMEMPQPSSPGLGRTTRLYSYRQFGRTSSNTWWTARGRVDIAASDLPSVNATLHMQNGCPHCRIDAQDIAKVVVER
jgi:hypothetical protein